MTFKSPMEHTTVVNIHFSLLNIFLQYTLSKSFSLLLQNVLDSSKTLSQSRKKKGLFSFLVYIKVLTKQTMSIHVVCFVAIFVLIPLVNS